MNTDPVPATVFCPIQSLVGIFDECLHVKGMRRGAGNRYGIRVIPTQIFFDPQGKELFRHEGFFSKDDILETWRRLGYQF